MRNKNAKPFVWTKKQMVTNRRIRKYAYLHPMTFRYSICALVLLLTPSLYGQESPLAPGIQLFEQEQYGGAIRQLEQVIRPDQLIHPREEARACWYLLLANQHMSQLPDKATGTQPLLEAFYYFGRFTRHPFHNEIATAAELKSARQSLTQALIDKGRMLYDQREYESSRNHLATARLLMADDPEIPRYMGRLYLNTGDTLLAISSLKKALDNPAIPERAAAEDYLLLSQVYAERAQLDSAILFARASQGLAPDDIRPVQQELSLYQRYPAFWKQSLPRFESAIGRFPEAHDIILAYAALLYEHDFHEEALVYYARVHKARPNNYYANVALGSHYIRKASAYQQRRQWEINDPEATHLIPEIVGMLDKAYPHIKLLHQFEMNEPKWIEQMITITTFLGLEEERLMYEAKRAKLDVQK